MSQHKTFTLTSPRSTSYRRLGVKAKDVNALPRISQWISRVPGGFDFCLDSLRSSSDPVARQFLKFYDAPDLTKQDKQLLPVEAFCLAAGIDPPALMNAVLVAVQTIGVHMSNLVAAIALPNIVGTSIEEALKPGGIEDRTIQLKHASFIPMPKGSQVNVQVNASANAQQALAPSPEDSIRRLQDHFSESRRTLHAEENASAAALPKPEFKQLEAMAPRDSDVQP